MKKDYKYTIRFAFQDISFRKKKKTTHAHTQRYLRKKLIKSYINLKLEENLQQKGVSKSTVT